MINSCHMYILKALSRDALDKLDTVKMKASIEKTHYQDMEEPIPDQISEKLEQINNLEDTIKVCIRPAPNMHLRTMKIVLIQGKSRIKFGNSVFQTIRDCS